MGEYYVVRYKTKRTDGDWSTAYFETETAAGRFYRDWPYETRYIGKKPIDVDDPHSYDIP